MGDCAIGRISSEDLYAERDDRFHRLKLIGWWDQERLSSARVLVIGAGALGNELIKNLALLGVGHVLIADLDTIENSNLSRSVLFREADCGKPKAEVAAAFARTIFPDIKAHAFVGNIVYDLGLGVYDWADVVLGGLDNREARLAMNRACYKLGKPYIDGAIEQLNGVARVFVPDGPCYECTMSKRDWELLEMRRSCALLTRGQMLEGKVPTTPTVSSIIAGVQVQEAVKYLHGLEVMAGKGFQYFGTTGESYLVGYDRKEECYSHDRYASLTPLDRSVGDIAVGELVVESRKHLGAEAALELNTDVLAYLTCRACNVRWPVFRSLGKVSEREGRCRHCGAACEVDMLSTVYGDEDFLERTLADIGVPPYDVVTAWAGDERIHWLFAADAPAVLGP
ncbi:MAG TPA: ThiF family adenylyltransferase, partial [Candidatus Hydrogenedentes bacterium]|nr:ThiF family adenylyltransferase [Candidatus Hydrogenedentota bacterium]